VRFRAAESLGGAKAVQRDPRASEGLFRGSRPFALAVASADAKASASAGRWRRPTTRPPLPGLNSPEGFRYQRQTDSVSVPS
jgi:hypothetical protein